MSNIKYCFTSRFTGGKIVNFDYRQLEVVALAVASTDPQLRKDLLDGIDIHAANCMEVHGKVTPELRTQIKSMTFQLQYGATAYGMSKSLGLPLKTCENFIDAYFARYPKIKVLHDNMIIVCEQTCFMDEELSKELAAPVKSAILTTNTGRGYKFSQKPRMKKDYRTGVLSSIFEFRPTEIKNYPIQGLATGDLVPIMVGQLYRFLLDRDIKDAMLINTVHDSIMFDVNRAELGHNFGEFLADVKEFLETAPDVMNTLFPDLKWDIPLEVSVEVGDSWGETFEYSV